jgi:hypothetical protein
MLVRPIAIRPPKPGLSRQQKMQLHREWNRLHLQKEEWKIKLAYYKKGFSRDEKLPSVAQIEAQRQRVLEKYNRASRQARGGYRSEQSLTAQQQLHRVLEMERKVFFKNAYLSAYQKLIQIREQMDSIERRLSE